MDNINLDAIITQNWSAIKIDSDIQEIKDCMKEAIHEALILVKKNARIVAKQDHSYANDYLDYVMIEEESILSIEKLIV